MLPNDDFRQMHQWLSLSVGSGSATVYRMEKLPIFSKSVVLYTIVFSQKIMKIHINLALCCIFLCGELASAKLLCHQFVDVWLCDVKKFVESLFLAALTLVQRIELSSGAMVVMDSSTLKRTDQLGQIFFPLIGLSVPFYVLPIMIKKRKKLE